MQHDIPGQAGNNHPTSIPTGASATRDGFINIAASSDAIFGRLRAVLHIAELRRHPDFATGAARS